MVNYTDITYVLTNKSGGEVLARKCTSPLPSPPLSSSPLPSPPECNVTTSQDDR